MDGGQQTSTRVRCSADRSCAAHSAACDTEPGEPITTPEHSPGRRRRATHGCADRGAPPAQRQSHGGDQSKRKGQGRDSGQHSRGNTVVQVDDGPVQTVWVIDDFSELRPECRYHSMGSVRRRRIQAGGCPPGDSDQHPRDHCQPDQSAQRCRGSRAIVFHNVAHSNSAHAGHGPGAKLIPCCYRVAILRFA